MLFNVNDNVMTTCGAGIVTEVSDSGYVVALFDHAVFQAFTEDELSDLEDEDCPDDYDGQPDEYTEWQDYMGGDDWDHGQYDNDCDLYNEW